MDIQIDPAKLDAAERSIDTFIDKRARDREAANAEEGLWAASDRVSREKRRQELKEAWHFYHQHMNKLHAALAQDHAEKAQSLMVEPGAG